MMEILAPAGGQEQLIAAVRCGADAVYLGAKGFNARRNAANFGENELEDSVRYCHERGVKVFVTVNTLVMDSEMEALQETCDQVAASGADGVILQDLSAAAYFRDHYPTIRRVASTQMAVHNVEGAKVLKDMGFSRLVLARETELREMEKIARVGVEMESFVHGALCVCLSGACYFSSMLGGRSGNRGLCAQPCRLNMRCKGREYALSMKDLSYFSRLKEVEEAGVRSLKIEGRMKRPEYVAAAVSACRAALDGKEYSEETLKNVFSRSGFTQGYLDGKRDGSMYGIRRKEDVEASGRVLGELAGLYRAERASVPVELKMEVREGGARLTAREGDREATIEGGEPFRAEKELGWEKNLVKTGGTPFFARSVEVDNPLGLALRSSEVNDMRRRALDELLRQRGERRPHPWTEAKEKVAAVAAEPPVKQRGEWWGRFERREQVPQGHDFARVILPLNEIEEIDERTVCELPAMLFPTEEERYIPRLEALVKKGLMAVYTENLYGVGLGKRLGLTVLGGAGLNVLNSRAVEEYADLGLDAATVSFECAMKKAGEIAGRIPRGLVVYGRLPLMRLRVCPARAKNGCEGCRGRNELTDERGMRFPIVCAGKRFVTVHNSLPLHIAGKPLADMAYYTFYFTTETRDECERVMEDYRLGRPSRGERTGGLYFRTLL